MDCLSGRVVNIWVEPYDVYIGRPSKWGNPYTICKEHTRKDVIRLYEAWIKTRPELLAALPELRGKRLGCYCAPLPCHGDVLVRLAEEVDQMSHSDELAELEADMIEGHHRYCRPKRFKVYAVRMQFVWADSAQEALAKAQRMGLDVTRVEEVPV